MGKERTLDPGVFVGLLPRVPTRPHVPTLRGGRSPPKLLTNQKSWRDDVTSHQADARAARPARDLSLGRAGPAPPRAAPHLGRATSAQRGSIWHYILKN